MDLRKKDITGKDAETLLDDAYITVNKNAVPEEPRSPFVTSGLRIGTPAVTTRGFAENEVRQVTGWICDLLDDFGNQDKIQQVKAQVLELCARFPVYSDK